MSPQHTWTQARYDRAQTLACDATRARIQEARRQLALALEAIGSDEGTFLLDDALKALTRARITNEQIVRDRLEDWDAEVVPCARGCGRLHQANQGCVCRG